MISLARPKLPRMLISNEHGFPLVNQLGKKFIDGYGQHKMILDSGLEDEGGLLLVAHHLG